MAKRFIDTSRYKSQWRTMPVNMRLTYYWLWENCDAAGVWEIDPDYFKFQTSMKWDQDGVLKHLAGHVTLITASAIWMIEFIEVNYGELKEGYNPHKPAMRSVIQYGLNVPIQDPSKLGKVSGNRSRVTKKVRDAIMLRDGMTCQYCATRLEAEAIVIDHFLPIHLGGDSSDENLLTSCFRCNSIKGQLRPETFINAKHPFLSIAPQVLIKLDNIHSRLEEEEEEEEEDKVEDGSMKIEVEEKKTRERKSANPKPDPPQMPFASQQFADAWAGYLAMRTKARKPPTYRAVELVLAKLAAMGEPAAIASLDASTVAGWTDVYPPKAGSQTIAERSQATIMSRTERPEPLRDFIRRRSAEATASMATETTEPHGA